MSAPLILTHRPAFQLAPAPILPEHRYDPARNLHVTSSGEVLVEVIDVGEYTRTQDLEKDRDVTDD